MSEGIELVLGPWEALRLAVRNRWGGGDSQAKADRLAASVLSWFTTRAAKGTGGRLDQDELEDLLHDAMDESFNAELDEFIFKGQSTQLCT